MKRTLFAALLFGSHPFAHADSWTNYLKIDCEPSIGYFSVRPVGTWAQGVEAPKSFIPIDNGWTYSGIDGELQMAPGSDIFGECALNHRGKDVVFSVVRMRSFEPSGCQGCGGWRANFEVRLNDHILAKGRHGRGDMRALKSVEYDGDEIRVCDSLTPNHYREVNEGYSSLSCEILGWREIREIVTPE